MWAGAVHHMWAEVLPHVLGAQRVGSDHVGEWGGRGGEPSLALAVAEAVGVWQACVCCPHMLGP